MHVSRNSSCFPSLNVASMIAALAFHQNISQINPRKCCKLYKGRIRSSIDKEVNFHGDMQWTSTCSRLSGANRQQKQMIYTTLEQNGKNLLFWVPPSSRSEKAVYIWCSLSSYRPLASSSPMQIIYIWSKKLYDQTSVAPTNHCKYERWIHGTMRLWSFHGNFLLQRPMYRNLCSQFWTLRINKCIVFFSEIHIHMELIWAFGQPL